VEERDAGGSAADAECWEPGSDSDDAGVRGGTGVAVAGGPGGAVGCAGATVHGSAG